MKLKKDIKSGQEKQRIRAGHERLIEKFETVVCLTPRQKIEILDILLGVGLNHTEKEELLEQGRTEGYEECADEVRSALYRIL